ncbi:hypothetical protein JCM8097_005993 [Rhodosporidiobolus ruineniae]
MSPTPPPPSADPPEQPSPLPRHISSMAAPTTQREHRLSGASEAQRAQRSRRASSPPGAPNRPSRLREGVTRNDSATSSFSSIKPTDTRQSTASNASTSNDRQRAQQEEKKKKRRAPPPNIAGAAPINRIRAIPDFAVSESDRTPGSQRGSDGSLFGSGSGEGEEAKEGGRSGGSRPLFAMGGVFPKHAPRRRRSSLAKEWQADEDERRGRTRNWRNELPVPDERDGGYASSSATGPRSASSVEGSSAGGQSQALDTNSADYQERTDPFDELEQRTSKLEPIMSDDGETPRPASPREGGAELEKRPSRSGSSATIAHSDEENEAGEGESGGYKGGRKGEDDAESDGYGEHAQPEQGGIAGHHEKQDEQKQQSGHEGGHEKDERSRPQDGGEQPALGGELNQNEEQWEQDLYEDDDAPLIRNWWGTARYALREPLAEFLGTMILIIIGIGSDCQTKISENTSGTYQSMNWAWGFGVMTAIYIAGGISGGHTNPSVTIVLALFRGFPWKLVPRYIIAQIAGAFCGALIIYGNYKTAIDEYDPNKLIYATEGANASATLFVTAPSQQTGGTVNGFFQEILAGGILTIAVLALGDENNAPPGAGLGAIVLGFVVTAIGMSNGWISGYAINSARDLGPRLALWCVGYGTKLWHHDQWWWLVGAVCGPLVGGIAGALAYDICIFTGPGSPVNYSSRELAEAVGIPKMHNMVRFVTNPHYRRRRLSATRTHNAEDLAESGLAPPALERRMSAQPTAPGRMSRNKVEEMAFQNRWKRGREKVWRQEEQSRHREQREREEWRRSIEELRQKEREKEERGPGGEKELRKTQSARA